MCSFTPTFPRIWLSGKGYVLSYSGAYLTTLVLPVLPIITPRQYPVRLYIQVHLVYHDRGQSTIDV